MRIGIVCPYSMDAPGGVQIHVKDLAARLIALGHTVSVLAPAEDDTDLPDYVVGTGRSVAVRYNGSVARLAFGPVTARRVNAWLERGDFDVVHIHEPLSPSVSLLALWNAETAVVCTFHTATDRSRAMHIAYPMLRPSLERIAARIAVSEEARRTVVEHIGGDAVVVPNGVELAQFRAASPRPEWRGTPERPTVVFLGRTDEPRKGLGVLLEALPRLRELVPGVRVLVAGRGDLAEARAIDARHPGTLELLGEITDAEKAELLRSADVYLAPQTGGESFGIVLVEAMGADAVVVASDIPAFRRVLDEGRAGYTFPVGDPEELARTVAVALTDREESDRRRAHAATWREQYDWDVVTQQVLEVYRLAVGEDPRAVLDDVAEPRTDGTSEGRTP
ncbi:phosphatidylinositol alpha-mannosyltransferase [Salana multivorans]|uniref:D-inositol 3-phosphate glycosyltransferase n=1 Tax=Salana multivorans TaxID=120377 RepID=A0A3N2D1I4_9MICO|nr:glycosyltransferase family 4 protein [Salana multivorans]MBN8880968.1 glycosyltransferase family 4 protein [Salana multivorans]OJX94393.1 MAG: alpha-(1-2)-phosphatidylinositol mannosyltransferase [Micrococcales bacterium 73-15]ROR93623.1 phosphatidylinositol alpha-mannosyltransferase [Salana multivorans]